MQTPEFEADLRALIDLTQGRLPVLMCAETVPWRCHRSLIADALTVRGLKVEHIVSELKLQEHRLTPFARWKAPGSPILRPNRLENKLNLRWPGELRIDKIK